MKSKKAMIPVIVFVLILIGVIAFAGLGFDKTASLVGYETVWKQNWGHICCIQGPYEPVYERWTDDQPTYKCDSYTDECRIRIWKELSGPTLTFGAVSLCYELDGKSYDYNNFQEKTITIPYGSTLKFTSCGYLQDYRKYMKYSATYRRFYIQGQENGKIFTQTSCILNADLKKRVLADGLNELGKYPPNDCQNYMIDFIQVATKTYKYNGQEVICQARNLYSIENMAFKDGQARKIQGNKLKAVDCCPGEPNCNADTFKFVENNVRECTFDSECSNGGDPVAITGESYVTFDCVDGTCKQSSPVQVECTNNAVCVNLYNKPNMVCKDWKCSEDAKWLGHCGDGNCESVIGETPTSCPDDCGQPKLDGFPWWVWILILLGIVVAVFFFWPVVVGWFKSMIAFARASMWIVIIAIIILILFGGVIISWIF